MNYIIDIIIVVALFAAVVIVFNKILDYFLD